MTFLNKQEIIEKLQSLPDHLPVVIERDCDVLRSTGIRKIEVVKARKTLTGSGASDNEYCDYCLDKFSDSPVVDVIWIS